MDSKVINKASRAVPKGAKVVSAALAKARVARVANSKQVRKAISRIIPEAAKDSAVATKASAKVAADEPDY